MKRIYIKPTRQILLIILMAVMAFSCVKYKESCVSKFIYIRTGGYAKTDSNDIVHYKSSYLEYRPDSILKIAKGKLMVFNCDKTPESKFCFDNFFKITTSPDFKNIIDSVLCDKAQDSSYINTGWTEHPLTLNIYIYITPKGEKTILIHEELFPKELSILNEKIQEIIFSKDLIKTNEFTINSFENINEQQLFKILTPPPPPSPYPLEQKVKFTKLKKKK